jgi:hemerythrin superfamily protein
MNDIPFEDAIDLLDADHKLVKQQFIDYQAMCEDGAPAEMKQELAEKICAELTVHAQIEEEVFYPKVREAIRDDKLMDEALLEHAQAKDEIAQIQGMSADDDGYDEKVQELGKAITHHVMEEREQIFLKARYSKVDLRGMVPQLYERRQQLKAEVEKSMKSRTNRGVPA